MRNLEKKNQITALSLPEIVSELKQTHDGLPFHDLKLKGRRLHFSGFINAVLLGFLALKEGEKGEMVRKGLRRLEALLASEGPGPGATASGPAAEDPPEDPPEGPATAVRLAGRPAPCAGWPGLERARRKPPGRSRGV